MTYLVAFNIWQVERRREMAGDSALAAAGRTSDEPYMVVGRARLAIGLHDGVADGVDWGDGVLLGRRIGAKIVQGHAGDFGGMNFAVDRHGRII